MFVRTAAVLIIALLSENSQAMEIKSSGYRLGTPLSDDSNMIPNITFSSVVSLLQKLFLQATQGVLNGTQLKEFTNTTAWTVKNLSDSATSMTQTIQANALSANYGLTKTTLGLLSATGKLPINLSDSMFDMTMIATAGENGTCQLDIQMILKNLSVDVDLSQLGLVGTLLNILVSLLSGLTTTIVNVLSGVLGSLLTVLLGEQIGELLNVEELCKSLLNATNTNFIPPDIF